MLFYILFALGLAGAVATVMLCGISPFWVVLLFPLYGLLLCGLQIGFFLCSAVLIRKDKPVPHIRHSYIRFQLYHSCYVLLRMMRVRIHVLGKEKLPKDKKQSLLFVSNHLSHFDPFVASTVFYKRGAVFVTKPENIAIPLFGRYLARAGFIPIDRGDPRSAMRAIQTAAQHMKEDTCAVGIYPEGTISRSKTLMGFHEGVFLAAKKADVPVVVTTLCHTEKIKKNWYRLGTDVYLHIVGVIPKEEVAALRTHELSYKAREMMRPSLEEAGYLAPPTEEAQVPDLLSLQSKPQETNV